MPGHPEATVPCVLVEVDHRARLPWTAGQLDPVVSNRPTCMCTRSQCLSRVQREGSGLTREARVPRLSKFVTEAVISAKQELMMLASGFSNFSKFPMYGSTSSQGDICVVRQQAMGPAAVQVVNTLHGSYSKRIDVCSR